MSHATVSPCAGLKSQYLDSYEAGVSPRILDLSARMAQVPHRQVISNILNNAMEFTEWGWVSIADAGISIAPEDHDRTFEKFQQVGDTPTDKPRGTGPGFCLCRDIVADHGGRRRVESQLGVDSTFSFALPVINTAVERPEADLVAA
jgi:signal transduction histidine kinase